MEWFFHNQRGEPIDQEQQLHMSAPIKRYWPPMSFVALPPASHPTPS